MDTQNVFRRLSQKMIEDFKISAEITHSGSKGAYREHALKDFLTDRRLPSRYGIGSGEIVGPARNVSRQSDLIIYDHLNGIALIYDDDTQVYPIECIAGTIEVKSTLNKTEFITALENIRSVKKLAPRESTTRKSLGLMSVSYPRPLPFGAVFAYQLGDNSLSSLVDNMKEWERSVPQEHWPNVVAVLDTGIIQHYGPGLRISHSNEDLKKATYPSAIHYRQDTLFHFYSILVDLCASTDLGPVVLSRYFRPAEQVGDYVVSNHDRFIRNDSDSVFKLSSGFISKVVSFCRKEGTLTHKELFLRRFGHVHLELDERYLRQKVFLYNPDGLKGIHEVEEPFTIQDGQPVAADSIMEPCHYIVVNGETYYIPAAYIAKDDLERVPGRTKEDL